MIDVRFGDAIIPPYSKEYFPVLLDFPKPFELVNQRETAIAEKYHPMVRHEE